MWNACPSHFSQLDITGLKNKHSLPLNGRPPCIQREIMRWLHGPVQLSLPCNTERLTNPLAYQFLVFIWVSSNATFSNWLVQPFIKLTGRFTTKQSRTESKSQSGRLCLRS